jgi:hypothetical protein
MLNTMNEEMADPTAFTPPKQEKEKDQRFYKISKNKEGVGSVLVRLIPSLNTERNKLLTFIGRKVHNAETKRNDDKRFINEICPNAIDKNVPCPICNYAWWNYDKLKADGREKDSDGKASKEAKEFLKFTANEKYITNILIIEDKENPDNEGKMFLFEYGPQIHELIKKQMQPSEEEQKEKGLKPFNAWDFVTGKNFRLKLLPKTMTTNGFPSWAESFFVTEASAIASTPEEQMKLIESTYCLDEFTSIEQCKSSEELQKNLDWALFMSNGQTVDTTPKQEKQAELGHVPGMNDKGDDLGEMPGWMKGGTTTVQEQAPFNGGTPVVTKPVEREPIKQTTTSTPVSPEEFMKNFDFN